MTIAGPPLALYSKEYFQDPYPTLAWLRENAPVFEYPFPGTNVPVWVVTRHEDIRTATMDRRFSTDSDAYAAVDFAQAGLGFAPLGKSIVMTDPPDHARLRRLAARTFTARRVQTWRQMIHDLVNQLLDSFMDRPVIDAVADYAVLIPPHIICRILGIDAGRRDFVSYHTDGVSSGDPDRIMLAGRELLAYTAELMAEKRRNPADDLISALIQARDENDVLSEEELLSMTTTMILGGFDTTRGLISNAILALIDHPDQWKLLMSDPSLTSNAVEEFLRFAGPIAGMTWRFTKEPLELGGVRLPARAPLLLVPIAANRDPARFPSPDTFDISRADIQHVGLGNGAHHCLGAALARLEGEIAIRELFIRFPMLRLACDRSEVRYAEAMFLHTLTELPIALR